MCPLPESDPDGIDISDLTKELADRFDIAPRFIRSVTIEPTQIKFTVYVPDQAGEKHLVPDGNGSLVVALSEITYNVVT